MTIFDQERLRALLISSSASLGRGLSDAEFDQVESHYGFRFGPDHRELLTLALPLGEGWPDWRDGAESDVRSRLEWPRDGVLFDVENNAFWPRSWGPRPEETGQALDVAKDHMRDVPKLVPVYSHRYLPAAPCPPRSPVFSVYQTDTIYYGVDLEDYLVREFGDHKIPIEGTPLRIPFWSELAEGREDEL